MSLPDSPDDELGDLDGLDDDELDRRLDEFAERNPPPRKLPPDLRELFDAISGPEILRSAGCPDEPPHVFEGFEAYHCVIGGMGMVIEARDPELERKVAIKLWKQSGPKAQKALLDEAKILARLSHRNVVTVHETKRWGERVFFVMEWIDGVDGHAWMQTPRTWREVRDVFVEAGRGLAAAHDAGIQHRDFKPANMLIGNDGRVVVADFGIADSLREVENTDPRWGTPEGTPAYMAPERLRGERGDVRSDQFSFCVAMWRGLYGVRPFAGEERDELLAEIERGELRTVAGVEVPRWLSEVVRRGLAYEADERHRDMHELIAALRDEPADELGDHDGGDDQVVVRVGGRVLHDSVRRPMAAAPRWPYVGLALLSTVVVLLAHEAWMREPASEQPVAEAVEFEPHQLLHGLIATDDFEKAQRFWLEHKAELTDDQSLVAADACLKRAKQLESVDRTKADESAKTALKIAAGVQRFGRTAAARKAGGQLVSEATAWVVDHPLRGVE